MSDPIRYGGRRCGVSIAARAKMLRKVKEGKNVMLATPDGIFRVIDVLPDDYTLILEKQTNGGRHE